MSTAAFTAEILSTSPGAAMGGGSGGISDGARGISGGAGGAAEVGFSIGAAAGLRGRGGDRHQGIRDAGGFVGVCGFSGFTRIDPLQLCGLVAGWWELAAQVSPAGWRRGPRRLHP
jgi:hypothetical protein